MPVYEFKCDKCGFEKEVLETVANACDFKGRIKNITFKHNNELFNSPCDGILRHQISITSFTLKGGCWFNDGYTKGEKK